ncbi:hypothetical protein BBJ28_00008186 [Nothophytophthora sp. Chile5]|nr:hypothetical protein BBJ28_00008186 [Nothophytophthora sp. Chile5]
MQLTALALSPSSSKNDISTSKIADFGLSDFYKPGAMMKTSCGSISYLAPEVFRGTSNAGPPLDVWSLGVILFAIVCGRLPFEGSDLQGTNRPRENVIRNRIMRCQFKLDEGLSPALTDLLLKMLKPDPSERATIPEIFSHPWVRGTAGSFGCLPTDFSSATSQDNFDDVEDDDMSFSITYAPAPSASSAAKSNDDDKLPSIVPRSSRTDVTSGSGSNSGLSSSSSGNGIVAVSPGGTAFVSSGTPSGCRTRTGRIMDNPLQQPKGSAPKLERHSPRPSITGIATNNVATSMAMPVALSPNHPASFKRYAASTGNSRGRPRQPGQSPSSAGSGSSGSGNVGNDKAHAERAPAHAGDSERLPIAHHKHIGRRSDIHDESADSPAAAHHGTKGAHASGLGSQLEMIGARKSHGHPELTSTNE